jgi:hypothetical protein
MNTFHRLLIITSICAANIAMGSETFRLDQVPFTGRDRSRYLAGAAVGALIPPFTALLLRNASRSVQRGMFGVSGFGLAATVAYLNRERIRELLSQSTFSERS